MKISTTASVLVLCLGCVSLVSPQEKHGREFTLGAIKTKLSADKSVFLHGGPVTVKVTVTNTAKEALYLPTTPYAWSILREDGNPVKLTPEGLERKKSHHSLTTMIVSVQLDAGKSITTEENIADLYFMDSPGIYLVSVQQEVRDESGTGYIGSNTLRITIK
jgi:hypothetical protein